MPWYRIDARAKEDGALLPGFDDLIFDKGVAFTTDSAAVSAARTAAGFGVGKIQDTELAPGRFHYDKAGGRPVFVGDGPPAPVGGSGGFEAVVADAGGILAGQPVIPGPTPGSVSAVLPDTYFNMFTPQSYVPMWFGALGFIGIAMESGAQGATIKVQTSGVATALAGGTIKKLDSVCASQPEGRLFEAVHAFGHSGFGSSGVRWFLRRAGYATMASAISLQVNSVDLPLSITMASHGAVRVGLAGDSQGDPISTAAEVVAFVNAHPLASQLIKAKAFGDGTGIVGTGQVTIATCFSGMNTVGIALADAEADELFPLLIRSR